MANRKEVTTVASKNNIFKESAPCVSLHLFYLLRKQFLMSFSSFQRRFQRRVSALKYLCILNRIGILLCGPKLPREDKSKFMS